MSVIYTSMKKQSVSIEASLEPPVVCTFHVILEQNCTARVGIVRYQLFTGTFLTLGHQGFFTGRM